MYGVRFEPLETFEGVLVTETVNTTSPVLIMNLAGLEEDVDYNISVRAYTSVGPGPYSVGIVERTDQDRKLYISNLHYWFKCISPMQSLMHLHRM